VPVLTSGARAVLVRAFAGRARAEPASPEEIVVALLESELPDPAAQLIAALGMDRARACERLRHRATRQAM
jgi:hypothetical protein